jgi:hypothetical protein
MKNKELENNVRIPMQLQLFAEGGDGSSGGSDDTGGEDKPSGGEDNPGSDEETPPSFDDFLKGEGNQAEFDRRVQKAVNTAVSNAQKKWQELADDKLSEAEKLAKMTKDEKTQYLQKKKEKELADREASITRKELMAEAKNTLSEKKLPIGLSEVLNYSDADSCNKSIAAVEKAFQEAVKEAVEERLKGDKPPKRAPESKTLEQQIESIMMGR